MVNRKICQGTGKPPIESSSSPLYPVCPICGKEFSGQGHKYSTHGYWREGCPKHFQEFKRVEAQQ